MLVSYQVARVAADPAILPRAARPGGWPSFVYVRLHSSPEIYYAAYSPEEIKAAAELLHAAPTGAGGRWCIFDNTAFGAATGQALNLLWRLG